MLRGLNKWLYLETLGKHLCAAWDCGLSGGEHENGWDQTCTDLLGTVQTWGAEVVLLCWQSRISCLPSSPYPALVFSILTYPETSAQRARLWCSPGRGVSRPCKSYQNGVRCLIFLHPWFRNPDYLLLQTNKTRMYWGISSLSGTRNIAGVAKLSSGGRKKVLVFSRGQQLWQMLKWCLPRLPHCSWVLAYYLPKKMTEWIQNRAFHGLLIGSDPPHSAGSQEQVYGSAAPVVLDHNPWPISCFFYWNKQIFLIGSVRRTAFLEAC